MDSGNSGSLQSSSGGDEEYDSRAAESFSAFISHPLALPLPVFQPPPPPPPPPFDPLSNYLQLQNSAVFNPNIFWPRNMNLRSEPYNNPSTDSIVNSPFMASFQVQPPTEVSDSFASPASAADNRTQNQNPTARNSKKRPRASRRAPTTVLTTDTTNFRAMVQEFTGIPAPPFTSSSLFQRSRLDIFGTPFSMRSKFPDAAQPPLLHRPFSQKVQSTPPPPPILASTASTSSSTSNAASSSTPPISHHHLSTQSSNLFNIPNPVLTSFLQTNHKFPFSSSILGSKTQDSFEIPSNDQSNVKIGGFDEFSLRHGSVAATLNTLPNLISSDQIQPRNDDHNNNNNSININDDLTSWKNNSVSSDEIDHDQAQIRLVHGDYNFSRNSRNEKMNYLGSTSNFHGEKEQENVATRSEGMVESWICSSE